MGLCLKGQQLLHMYRQLLGVRGEGPHIPGGLCPPQDQGQAGSLAGDTGDINTLKGMHVDFPDLCGSGQPGVPAWADAGV